MALELQKPGANTPGFADCPAISNEKKPAGNMTCGPEGA
jgi:hypothetical protein